MSDMPSENAMTIILEEWIKEQRRKRRWGIFFKFFIALFAVTSLLLFYAGTAQNTVSRDMPHTALIDIRGVIMPGGQFDADHFAASLRKAYKDEGTKGIIIRINSPGGAPVQADYMFNEIMRLRKKHPNIPVYAVCTDVCASAAYYIASATKDIYANPSSLVGSIGVIMNSFGFKGAIQKLGITRRVITAGRYKDFMDPFTPLKPQERKFAQQMVDSVHQQFIAAVKKGRGDRLKTSDKNIFSGLAWTGMQAKKLGLVDAYGSAGFVARDVIKQETIVNYTVKTSPLDRLVGKFGASFANVVLSKFTALSVS